MLLFVGLLTTGCDSFKTHKETKKELEKEQREERKRALLREPKFQNLVKNAEQEFTAVFIAVGLEDEFDAKKAIELELKHFIKSKNKVRYLWIGNDFEAKTER